MAIVETLGRAVGRLKTRGAGNTWRYALHLLKERMLASTIDLAYGGRVCRTNLDQNVYKDGRHTMVHTDYHVLRDIFATVPIADTDVLVDVGCGEGRVINFWLSEGRTNPIIGIEFVDAVAKRSRERYRKYENVSIVSGDAIDRLPLNGTLFYLYNPFSDETVARFEEAIRPLNARVVFNQNNYMKPFESELWRIDLIRPEGKVYEFQAALITKRERLSPQRQPARSKIA